MAVIKNVYCSWIKIATPADNFNKDGKEWVCDFVLSEKQVKEFKKKYPSKKGSIKEIPTDEFERKFKFAPPYPEQDEQNILKLKQSTTKANGQPNKQPKVYLNTGAVKDGKPVLEDITQDSQKVGNGSLVSVSVTEYTPKGGPTAGKMTCYLSGIRVDELVEYAQEDELGVVGGGGSTPDEFEEGSSDGVEEVPPFDTEDDEDY